MNLAEIANTYETAPEYRGGLWRVAGAYFRARADVLRSRFTIAETTEPEPYGTAAEQAADLRRGLFLVTSAYSEHPVWNVETNVAFRICHDIDGHGKVGRAFDPDGEVEAYRATLEHLPTPLRPVVFCESIGQLAATIANGRFPTQRTVLFPTVHV
mgnify:CR=1 FL=1